MTSRPVVDVPARVVRKLTSGLNLGAVHLPRARRAVLEAHVRVGSRYEQADDNGISHFLEHMLHRGIPKHPSAHAQAYAFEELGAALSAATYADHGTLSVQVPPENLSAILPMLADVLLRPIFSSLEIEKGIVREEILEGVDERGKSVDPETLLRSLAFDGHPLGFPIAGNLETLERFDLAMLERHHRAHYVAGGTVITLAGPLEPEIALREAEAAYASIPAGAPPSVIPPAAQAETRFLHVREAGSQSSLRVGFRAASERDPLEPATELLLRVLDDGMATRLYQRLCDDRGLCYDVSANYEAYADAGLFEIAADTAHERLPDVLAEILGIARTLRDTGPSEAELAKAKRRYAWQLAEYSDDPAALAAFYSLGELTGAGQAPDTRLAELEAVSLPDLRRAAAELFTREHLSVVVVGRLSKKQSERLERSLHEL
ncbi:MAG TPA: pitrilysin family protein [Polyangiaceae bacterium]